MEIYGILWNFMEFWAILGNLMQFIRILLNFCSNFSLSFQFSAQKVDLDLLFDEISCKFSLIL